MKIFIEYPVGNRVAGSEFPENSTIKVQVTNANAFFNVDLTITFENTNISPYYMQASVSAMGNAYFILTLPSEVSKGILTVTEEAFFPIPAIKQSMNIGIGTPADETVPPEGLMGQLQTILKWTAIGAGVIAVILIASKAMPSISEGYRKTRKALK